jgi:predicted metal-dependent hydrolase
MRDIETAIQKKARWITGKLDYFLHQVPDVSPFYPADGTPLPYLGYTLTLRLIPAETDEIRLHEKTRELFVHFRASSEQLVERIISWLREEAARILAMRVRHYASVMHMETPPLTLSSARRCWGSCSRNGHIRLNWRLVHCAPRQIDYVIVHELAHTKEMNHSKHFWRIVSEVFPDYAAVRKELNGQGARLLSLF